jgi:Zn-dependent metalloprotease
MPSPILAASPQPAPLLKHFAVNEPSSFVLITHINGKDNPICKGIEECTSSKHPVARTLSRTALAIQKFFLENFGLNGIDGKGNLAPFAIGLNEKNARWNCGYATGKSCRWEFHPMLATSPTVVAHEYTHAVTNYLNNLASSKEAGALKESIADVLSVAFKQKQSSKKDYWKIGNSRDLSKHADMNLFRRGLEDNGYIHDNSLIPSHAFYLAVKKVQGAAYGILSHIWLEAYKKLSYEATFKEFAERTIEVSKNYSSKAQKAVLEAWKHVGLI